MKTGMAELAGFVEGLSYDDLPKEVVHACKRQILDAITTAVAATRVPGGSIVAGIATLLGSTGENDSTVVVTGERVAPSNAAFANAQLSIALDLGSNLLFSQGLPGVTIFPALALAEQRHQGGRDLIAAVAAGYEVASRVAMSFPPHLVPSPDRQRVVQQKRQPKSRWVIFGGAAATAKILDLPAEQVMDAISLAGGTAILPPRRESYGWTYNAMVKYGLFGNMAWSSVVCGFLARAGFSGDHLILDRSGGFHSQFGCRLDDRSALSKDLGSHWWILKANFKRFPSGTHNQAGLWAVMSVIRKHELRPDDIESVTVGRVVGVLPPFQNQRPANYIEAQFSLPFQIAMLLLEIPEDRWQDMVDDPTAAALCARIHLTSEPEALERFNAGFDTGATRDPWWHRSKVTIRAKGRSFVEWSEYGDVSDDELAQKFRANLEGILPTASIERCIKMVLDLETVSDVTQLTRLLVRS